MTEFEIYYSDAIPKETAYLMPRPDVFSVGPVIFRRDPWEPPTYRLDPAYEDERHRALGFLADLLDGMCEHFGMDPEQVWRDPKWREQWRHDQMRFVAHERIALSTHRPTDFVKVIP